MEEKTSSNTLVKQLIWAYFWLLIFEGALRKWLLPELSAPLLIVRDPIAILIFFIARNRGLLPLNGFVLGMSTIGILGIFTSMVSGHRNLFVSLYGARAYLIHFPLIFIIGRVFEREDILKMGKMFLWTSLPMIVLIGFQFYSPQSAWVNRGIGGDVNGGGFTGAMGYYRPPGTFSFTTGVAQYFSFVGVFVFYFWLSPKGVNIFLLISSTIALLAALPFSISRALFFQTLLTLAFALLGGVRKPKHILRLVIASLVVVVIVIIGSNSTIIQTSIEVLETRFSNASSTEGGVEGTIIDRFLGGLIGALTNFGDWPIFGYGLGIGSNVASMLLRGFVDFTVGEDEWTRTIGELGPFLGLALILIRIFLTGSFGLRSFKKLIRDDFLSWVFFSLSFLSISQGNWSQPTSLGFCVLAAGLNLASLEDNSIEMENDLRNNMNGKYP
ncbi:MAG: hypothetical protein K2Q22_15560 [Cytophagales bacterium]|nr:hypothetical protein [Cytophagales bacterium]